MSQTVNKLWQQNPQITAIELCQAIEEKGFKASRNTGYNWLKRFREGRVEGTYGEKPVTAVGPSEKFTLEQIIEAAGSVETLSLLFYQGVMRELGRKDAVSHLLKQECIDKDNRVAALKRQLNDVTRERNQIMRDYNEKLARVKVGTVTVDETRHRLIPKL